MRVLLKRSARNWAPASALTVASGGDSAPFERPEKGDAVELRSADAADRARFGQLARHLRSPALAHDKLGLSVGGNDQLLAFRQAINQAGIVVEFADRNGLHNSARRYRLTLQSCNDKRQERQ